MILGLFVYLMASHAFAGAATCSSYTAELSGAYQGKIVIHAWAQDYVREHGYTDVGTSISGAVRTICDGMYGQGDNRACGLEIKNVVQQEGSEDCYQ
jgi:hypothetical protein